MAAEHLDIHAEDHFAAALGDAEIAAWAVEHGLLPAGQPLSDGLRSFVFQVVEYCARLGDGYATEEGNAGEHVRAAFGL